MTLVEFLTARLDEDEAEARAAVAGGWTVDVPSRQSRVQQLLTSLYRVAHEGGVLGEDGPDDESIMFYTRKIMELPGHDPARVLREVEAKRRIVRHCLSTADEGLEWDNQIQVTDATYTLRYLAAVHADHPDYREEWKP